MNNTIYDEDFMYYVFCLGYDDYFRKLSKIDLTACDLAFEDSISIVRKFWQSEENKQNKSGYECLQDFLKRRAEEQEQNKKALLDYLKATKNDFNNLIIRLQDNYNNDNDFIQHEEDRTIINNLLEYLENL